MVSMPDGQITHVSDTALLVAACRAIETADRDGWIRDPFAARLAGERGMAMLQSMPHPEMMRFGMAVRTRFIDELLLDALASHPIATVLSMGCGLDTRPWRLDLPAGLHWIEVDFADMLDYKESLLSVETPRCRRERLTADLNDAAQRSALYASTGPHRALMITEGLLMYLPAATVEALAEEAPRHSGIARWMTDITSTSFEKAINMDLRRTVGHVQATDCLKGEQILDVVRRYGWNTSAHRSYITDVAFALPRILKMTGERPSGPPPELSGDPTGIHVLSR